MIHRTIAGPIEESIRLRPVTLVTGAPGVGKTTLCRHIGEAHGFGYVSLSKGSERMMAIRDPDLFLHLHPAPVIIDDIQYAPNLFDAIRGRVDEVKYTTDSNTGMYILISNQCFGLMKGVTESMAGRVGIIRMSPLSMSEVLGREEVPFRVDMGWNTDRAMGDPMSVDDVYG